jgi:hypothetical protein
MRDRDALGLFLTPRVLLGGWEYTWLVLLDPPWRRNRSWKEWLKNYAFALLGLVLGALAAPSLVHVTGLAGTAYQDALVVAVAVVSSLGVHLVGWRPDNLLMVLSIWIILAFRAASSEPPHWLGVSIVYLPDLVEMAVVFAAIGYGVSRYVTWVSPGQREVTIAFVGGLRIKMVFTPLIRAWSRARRSNSSGGGCAAARM